MSYAKKHIPVDDLITAWHSDRLTEDLADQFGISIRCLRNAWNELRALNVLPPTLRNASRMASSHSTSEYSSNAAHQYDGRPSVGTCDALLDSLRREHHQPRPDIARELLRDVQG